MFSNLLTVRMSSESVSDLDLRVMKQVACTRGSVTFSLMFHILAFFGFKGACYENHGMIMFSDVILTHCRQLFPIPLNSAICLKISQQQSVTLTYGL